MATDKEALICDLAETYGIYNYRSLPPTKVAAFSVGLRENSRIRLKMNNMHHPLETVLLAAIADRLSLILWTKTKDGEKGINRPKSIVEQLSAREQDIESFNTREDFERRRSELIREAEDGE